MKGLMNALAEYREREAEANAANARMKEIRKALPELMKQAEAAAAYTDELRAVYSTLYWDYEDIIDESDLDRVFGDQIEPLPYTMILTCDTCNKAYTYHVSHRGERREINRWRRECPECRQARWDKQHREFQRELLNFEKKLMKMKVLPRASDYEEHKAEHYWLNIRTPILAGMFACCEQCGATSHLGVRVRSYALKPREYIILCDKHFDEFEPEE